jgi:hypothetical protein
MAMLDSFRGAGEMGRILRAGMISVLAGAIPKEAASISACDPNFS